MRFSVLVPVYNRPILVKETIESVLSQTFADYELVLIDDGSTDNTLDVLKSYGNRVRVMQQKNQGPEAARHNAASVTTGEYFVLLDSDDLLMPNALETYDRIIRSLDSPPVIMAALSEFRTGDVLPVKESDGVIELLRYDDLFARDRPVGSTCSQIVARRDVVQAAGAFRASSTAFPFDTADIMLSLSTHGPWVNVLRPATIAYRLHASNTIANLEYMLRTASCLLRLERQGRYPGGASRRFDRWAYIGGVTWNWCRRALAGDRLGGALVLFFHGAPMIGTGVLRKVAQKFRSPSQPIRLVS